MGAYEQHVEESDNQFQYLLVAAEPYETCGFKLESKEIDKSQGRFFEWFDEDSQEFWVNIMFKTDREAKYSGVPGMAPNLPKRL